MAANIRKALHGYDPAHCQVSGLESLVYITNLHALPRCLHLLFWLDFSLIILLGVYGRNKKDKHIGGSPLSPLLFFSRQMCG